MNIITSITVPVLHTIGVDTTTRLPTGRGGVLGCGEGRTPRINPLRRGYFTKTLILVADGKYARQISRDLNIDMYKLVVRSAMKLL